VKRIIGLLVFASLLVTPCLAVAAGGLYIAPKFNYGSMKMSKFGLEGQNYMDGFLYNNKKTDSLYSGALAVGYDFRPLRFEVEYAMFSQAIGEEFVEGSSYEYFLLTPNPAPPPAYFEDTMYLGMRQKLKMQALFLNAYYDFRNETPFSFWVGGGVGLALIDHKARFLLHVPDGNIAFGGVPQWDMWLAGKDSRKNIAWNVGAGVGYNLTKSLVFDVGYRFSSLGRTTTKEGAGVILSAPQNAKISGLYMHQLILGLRLGF